MGGRGSAGRSSAGASAAPSAPQPPGNQDIVAAYELLAPRKGAWLRITDVREKLRDLMPRATEAEIDAAFRRVSHAPNVDMMPESNQKTLRPEDRRNAVRYGGQDAHLIAFGLRR